jgi:hypothetical protein
MADIQTVENDASVDSFLNSVENVQRRQDAISLRTLMERVTGLEAKMWGPAIVGFGKCRYTYASGQSREMPRVAFSPRKANLVLYMMAKDQVFNDIRTRLGTHKVSDYCLYINKLEHVDSVALEELVRLAWDVSGERHGPAA